MTVLSIDISAIENDSRSKLKRWAFSVNLAGALGGPSKGIKEAMIAANFSDIYYGFFGEVKHPLTRQSELQSTYLVNICYCITHLLCVGFELGNVDLGETAGLHSPGQDLILINSSSTMTLIFSVKLKGFKVGIGPAFYRTKAWRDDQELGTIKKVLNKTGLLFNFSFAFPEKSRFFVEAKAQYRIVGNVEIGPYTTEYGPLYTGTDHEIYDTATMPATIVSFNHMVIGFGVGFRI